MSDLSLTVYIIREFARSGSIADKSAPSLSRARPMCSIFVNQDVVKWLDLARRAGINLSP